MPMSRAEMTNRKRAVDKGVGSIGLVRPRLLGWWEEYRCGCVSATVKHKRELVGYCAQHGEDRRYAHKDVEWPNV